MGTPKMKLDREIGEGKILKAKLIKEYRLKKVLASELLEPASEG